MKVHRVEIGERFSDDSGWERLVALDEASGRLVLEMGGADITIDSGELDWLIEALQKARDLTRSA